MHGHHHHRPPGGARPQPPPPGSLTHPQLQQFHHHNLPNPNLYFQNPSFPIPQNPSFPIPQNPSFPIPQNPSFPIQQNPSFSIPQNPYPYFQNPTFSNPRTPNLSIEQRPSTNTPQKPNLSLDKIESAVIKAHNNLVSTGGTVSAWSVSESALLSLQVDSWSSLGFRMQQVPSLYSLMVIEGKVNSFIHCFVGSRKITTLYELDSAICKNEGIDMFEELKLGPLLKHPLVIHYFSIPSDTTEVHKITSEDLISRLSEVIGPSRRKRMQTKGFLEYVANKESLDVKEKLGVRITSLGYHLSCIQESRRAEESTLKNYRPTVEQNSSKQGRKEEKVSKPPPIDSQKKVLDERFSNILQRVEAFSPINDSSNNKHTRFISSSSEDENDADSDDECKDKKFSNSRDISCNDGKLLNKGVTSCPYPSALEEMNRLGLKAETDEMSPATGALSRNTSKKSSRKKRRYYSEENEAMSCKFPKTNKADLSVVRRNLLQLNDNKESDDIKTQLTNNAKQDESNGLLLDDTAMDRFIATWKDTCRVHSVTEVFKRMIDFYATHESEVTNKSAIKCFFGRKRKINSSISSCLIGLINIAIKSIKCGMWDNLYDTFQTIGQHGCISSGSVPSTEVETIDVNLPIKRLNDRSSQSEYSATVDDILEKVTEYVENNRGAREGKSLLENQLICLRRLRDCEIWLTEQFSVREFGSFGCGNFLNFLHVYCSRLPNELFGSFNGDAGGKSLLEVSVSRELVVVLLSQAASGLWANDAISKHHITLLLKRQFPILSLQVGGDDNVSSEDLSEILKQENSNFSSSVLFSATLLRSWYVKTPSPTKHHLGENTVWGANLSEEAGSFGSFLTKDAMDCLLKAPMLSDLKSWSHWDVVFAPSLGPLLPWLLNEVHTEELLCIVTGDGKILRIDRAVTVSDFLEAALRGSPFETAAKLLSLLPDFGGDKNLSLLKRHAHQAIEVILKNSLDSGEVRNSWDIKMQGGEQNFAGHRHGVDKAIPVASKFILDCLGYLPSEFCTLAADIFLYGLRPFTNDAPSAILRECSQINQRMMIHEIGLSLGILEWIADYRTFSSRPAKDFLVPLGISNSKSSPPGSKLEEIDSPEPSLNQLASHGNVVVKVEEGDDQLHTEVNLAKEDVSDKGSDDCCVSVPFTHDEDQEPALIVESIRHEEFGLVPSLTHAESSMLKKQHARLGRALHCLSQELYSQDSHFLLELVQNADDNIYPESVEPTLVFILQPAGIVVLNNEQGFSAKNIRALCDVGNSTKRGSSAGYIGQKGIGFKSVFRVTDAPEIHSNGFHVKFDISEGQIGFVLPTIVSPCDIDLYGRLVPAEVGDQIDKSRWKTCIVLPFKSKLTEGTGLSTIISKFSDLHPSLLLFLHRLRCIKFKNMLTNDCVVMRRETLGNGIVRVSHGKEKMSWLVASQKLQASALRPEVQNTEIAIAFTLEESSNGEYIPHTEQQPVFAFLPLRTYGLKFILQGDFVLPSSREEVDEDSAWNQWLLSELPSLFVSAQNSFCALPCFRESPGKAVVAYMSFVPLVGEVHGFFSHLPRMIISKLRVSNCMLLEGHNNKWVPPCQVLRGWDEPARNLLSGSLLMQHLGLGYLNKDIVLSDPLAKALGVRDYGPKILVDIISSICHANDGGMKSMGLDWLASCLSEIYIMLVGRTSGSSNLIIDVDSELNKKLRHIPFIPLSDGTYSSVAEGTIWLPSDSFNSAFEGLNGLDAFPSLYAKVRTVSSDLLTLSGANNNNCEGDTPIDNCVRLLARIGIQRLSAHDIVMVHILPAISDDMVKNRSENLMIEYLSFIMLHLQSNCPRCCVERERIMYELRNKAFILTNHGYRRPVEVPIHFSKEFGNPVDMTKLIGAMDSKWLEIDIIYLKRTSIKNPFLFGLAKWREFFQELGITDFVQIKLVEKNIANASSTILKDIMHDQNLISPDLVIKDWDSPELASLLASLSAQNDQGKCKYLLQVLDELWDDCFSSKVTACCVSKSIEDGKLIRSSVIRSIHDVQWIVSSVDQELHYPKDVFHDCEAVRSLIGAFAPYSVPQVRSRKFVTDMGFKAQVTLDDALKILEVWRKLGAPFRTSIAHMSNFYSFIWDGVDNLKSKITEEFSSRSSIFVPFDSISRRDDAVSGMFLSRDEVYWHDPTGSVDWVKELLLQSGSVNETNCHLSNTLAQVYPGLHDFFVNKCGVHEMPSFRNYIQILLQLSKVGSSSQAANTVFQVILKLADDINSGLVGSDDAIYFKEFLQKLEHKVLPTTVDKWVSLHPKFGLVCWCNDEELRKQFKNSDNISFLYFGELSKDDREMLPAKVSRLMETIGVRSLSEVITREPIFYGVVDNKDKVSLVDWVLPFAQRYMNKLHLDKYFQLKQSGFEKLSSLQVIVVEKLFYRYALKGSSNTSNKRTECSCLLQENILYVKRELESHSLFLELSRLFFNGTPELHLANFLYMIATMAESGSTEDQTEFFILNSQKIPKLPDSEPLWCLSSPSLAEEDSEISQPTSSSLTVDEHSQLRFKRKPETSTNWPPADWKTAPDFNFFGANDLRTRFAGDPPPSDSCEKEIAEGGASYIEDHGIPLGFGVDWNIQDESVAVMAASLQETIPQGQQRTSSSKGRSGSSSEVLNQSVQVKVPAYPDFVPFSEREQLSFGTPNEYQAAITGRLGEFIAFKYFTEKVGGERVNWVNKETETGLPYDIVIGKDEESKEYIEVKATKSGKKDWFRITSREWQFAVEKGESYSVAHVLMDVKNAKVTVLKNPMKLCQQGMLQLAVLMSRNPKRLSSGS